MRTQRGGLLAVVMLLGAGCSSNGAVPDAGADGGSRDSAVADAAVRDLPSTVDTGSAADGARDAQAADAGGPLECFELSLDPNSPLAIDGTFGAGSVLWKRPHDDPPVCPATALLPATAADVPRVAYAFCNNDTKAHTFDVEMLASTGPAGEPPLDDPYLIVYAGKQIPTDARQCLAINDTIPGALGTEDAELRGITVQPGAAITVVGTTFTFDLGDGTGTGYYILVVTINDQ